MDAGARKIFFTQRSQPRYQLGAHGRNLHQQLRRGQARPCWPFGIVFRAIAREFRHLFAENAIDALEKYLVIAGEVGELLMGRPFAGDRPRAERLCGNAT